MEQDQRRVLLALKSSNHRDRTERDRKTDRAYHLMRFFGTDEQAPAPPFDDNPRVRRELIQINQAELNEQERKLAMTQGRRPGETAEAYDHRKRVQRDMRRKEGDWKWILEDEARQSRWEGKEDVTQTSNYVVVFPPTSDDEPIKVAFLDHWIDMRKHVDNAERKKERHEEVLRQQIRIAAIKNAEDAKQFAQGDIEGGAPGRIKRLKTKRQKPTFVVGRESEATSKNYKKRGVVDSDDEDDGGLGNNQDGERGVLVEDLQAEDEYIDHEHGLAIDRVREDGDEFQDVDYEFDDDDEGLAEAMEGEDDHGLADGEVAVSEAVQFDEEEDGLDEDAEASSSENEEDGEEEEEEPTRPNSRVPVLTARSTSPIEKAVTVPVAVRFKSLEQQMREFVIEKMLNLQGKTKEVNFLLKDLKAKFGDSFDRNLAAQVMKDVLIPVSDAIDGKYFALNRDKINN